MADVYVRQKGSKLSDGTEQIDIPIKFTDNGDGSFSFSVSTDLSNLLTELKALQTVTQTATQVVAVGTDGTTRSLAVGGTTTRVILTTTTDCWVSIGSPTPTAVLHGANSFFLKAGASSYPMSVIPSSSVIAVIQDSAAGYLSILESA